MLQALLGLAAAASLAVACGDDASHGQSGSSGQGGETAGTDSEGGSAGSVGPAGGGASANDGGSASTTAGESSGGSASTTCGDGLTQPGECEPAGTALCSDDCVAIATRECLECEQGSPCYEFSENCLAFEGEERTLCYDVHECVAATDCADGDSTLTSCFCGELSTSECIDGPNSGLGSPMGPCAGIIRRALGSDASNSQVLTRYLNVAYPGGGALARMNCDKVVPECLEICGF